MSSVAEQGEWSGILSVSVEGPSPALVQAQVNEIANVYVRQNVERMSAEAQQTLEFLDEQLPVIRANMEAAELSLNSYRLEKGFDRSAARNADGACKPLSPSKPSSTSSSRNGKK